MKYTVIGVSSGIGVSLYPFKKELIANFEHRPIFRTAGNIQWRINFPKIPLYTDFESSKREIIELPPIDVIISSPDCGSGSILRYSRAKKLGDHKKNTSLDLFFLLVAQEKPKFFEFENLAGLFKSFPEEEFCKILGNYRLIKHNASVSRWGNSQIHRKRLVVIGIRKDLSKKIDRHFKLPNYGTQTEACSALYGDLDGITDFDDMVANAHVREPLDEVITIYAGKKMTVRQIRDYWQNELKSKKRWVVTDRKFTTAPGVYRNLSNHYPSTARKANRQFDHNGLMLTPRQLARIQGVPDPFEIYIDPERLKYWINKGRAAVTKCPPFQISFWFKKKLDKTKRLKLW